MIINELNLNKSSVQQLDQRLEDHSLKMQAKLKSEIQNNNETFK